MKYMSNKEKREKFSRIQAMSDEEFAKMIKVASKTNVSLLRLDKKWNKKITPKKKE